MRWSAIVGPQLNVTGAALLIALALTSAISFAYAWLLEAGFGATLGKAIVGIRVIRTNGRHRRVIFDVLRTIHHGTSRLVQIASPVTAFVSS